MIVIYHLFSPDLDDKKVKIDNFPFSGISLNYFVNRSSYFSSLSSYGDGITVHLHTVKNSGKFSTLPAYFV